METKANHLAVGGFVLIGIAGLIVFILWLGKARIDREFDEYFIYFRGSVTGLSVASTVRYRGVPVGSVTDVRIDPDNSERVRVTIEVNRGTPIKEDSVAALEMQGITGLVNVQISGGSRDSPPLKPRKGQKLAVIKSKASKLEELFEDLPNLLARATTLVDRGTVLIENTLVLVERGNQLLDEENTAAIVETLENVRGFTANLDASTDDLVALRDDVSSIATSVRSTAAQIETMVADVNARLPGLLDDASRTLKSGDATLTGINDNVAALTGDARDTLRAAQEAAEKLAAAADQLNLMVAENRPALRDFSGDGLYELTRFLVEARDLVAGLARLSERLEADPARFIFGDAQAGFTPE